MSSIREIASNLGISPAAVSMAMNNHPSISVETKARVWEVQRTLGYRPNLNARRLRRQSQGTEGFRPVTGNVAFILMNRTFEDPAYVTLFQGVSDTALEKELHPFYFSLKSEEVLAGKLPSHLRDCEVDGLILSGLFGTEEYQILKALKLPLVVLGNYELHETVMTIETDIAQGVTLAMEKFHALGHRRVALVSETFSTNYTSQMLRAFGECSERLFGKFDPALAEESGRIMEGGFAPTRRLLESKNQPTAILLAAERMGAAAYDLCAEKGLKIPEDLSLISFGENAGFYHYRPSLEHVSSNTKVIGQSAASKLLDLIRDPKLAPSRTLFPMTLIPGESTGALSTR